MFFGAWTDQAPSVSYGMKHRPPRLPSSSSSSCSDTATSEPQPCPKPEFWRIRDIHVDNRGEALEWLHEQSKGRATYTIAGYDSFRRSLCGTFTTAKYCKQPVPPRPSWHVDKTFIGITPLYDPPNATVDLLAVTGLGGHALGSFRDQDNGTTVWLRDFAPQDIPRARIMTYGYETRVIGSESTQGVEALAQTLLRTLASFRQRTKTSDRPLVILAHSLGGIIVKEALVQSERTAGTDNSDLHDVLLSTRGLVLMGVPTLGLNHECLRTVVAGRPNAQFISDLLQTDGKPSSFLNRLTQDFARLCRAWPWKVITFYETEKSATIEEINQVHSAWRDQPYFAGSRSMQWAGQTVFQMTGPKVLMVDRESAERVTHEYRELDHHPSPTDHRGLVRFDHAADDRYQSMMRETRRIMGPLMYPRALQLPYSPDSSIDSD